VPRVRLRVYDDSSPNNTHRQFIDPRAGNTIRVVPVLRLVTTARLHAPLGSLNTTTRESDALIDTGIWVSAIASGVWEEYERVGLLERLPHPASGLDPVPGGGLILAGGRSAYSWGRLWVRLIDRHTPSDPNPRCLPESPMPIVVQLLHDAACRLPYPILFGFHLGILDGHRLARESVMGHDNPVDRRDSGPRYGQEWHLETS
jgi:hypothetical protein